MIRINLLPPEIIEKRKFEGRITYVGLAALVVVILLGVVYGFMVWQVSGKNDVLQQNKEAATQLLNQANSYEVFQEKEDLLDARMAVAAQALANRADWGRIANEISLILPSDVWLVYMAGSEEAGMEIAGNAVDSDADVPDVGHKAVAKTLVRLADLELLNNVWLTSSAKADYADTGKQVIEFTITAGVVRSAASMDSSANVPAPPSQTP